jgi:hypothetical protein
VRDLIAEAIYKSDIEGLQDFAVEWSVLATQSPSIAKSRYREADAVLAVLADPPSDVIEAGARALAELEPGEAWPSNYELGGGPTGTRDDEYRSEMLDQARMVLQAVFAVAPNVSEKTSNQGKTPGQSTAPNIGEKAVFGGDRD